jgi:hypothetical protein
MTEDELHRDWNAGLSVHMIAARAGTTGKTIAGRVRRLRQKQGLERWPYHASPIKSQRTTEAPSPPKPKPLPPGASTLPPLASLEGHGETSRR